MKIRPRQVLINIAVTVVSIVIVLAVIEVVLRATNPGRQFHCTVNTWDREVGTRHVPGARGFVKNPEYEIDLIINSKGLRDREFSYAKPDRTRRILCLGDSFTFGYGVEAGETYPKVMERSLNAARGQGQVWEVLNAGVGSTGTAQQLAYFVSEGYRYEPDFVVLCFFPGNDFWDNVMCGLYSLEDGRLLKHDAPTTPSRKAQQITRWIPFYSTFFARSHLLNFIKARAARYHYRELGERARGEKGDSAIERDEIEITRALLLALGDACKRIDCQLVLTAIPASGQEWSLSESTLDLIAAAESSGTAYVDIREPFARVAGEGVRLAYEVDRHWTREGHEVAGRALSAFFMSEPDSL